MLFFHASSETPAIDVLCARVVFRNKLYFALNDVRQAHPGSLYHGIDCPIEIFAYKFCGNKNDAGWLAPVLHLACQLTAVVKESAHQEQPQREKKRRIAWFAVEPCLNLACTHRYEGQEKK